MCVFREKERKREDGGCYIGRESRRGVMEREWGIIVSESERWGGC